MTGPFQRDAFQILLRKSAAGEIDRRSFVKGAALLLGLPLALRGRAAWAADQLVLANWGGDAIEAFQKAFGEAFTKATGVTVRIDGSGPTEGAIKAQLESGKIIWDVVDADANLGIAFGKKGVLEPIDYAVVDRAKVRKGFDFECGIPGYFFSYVLVWDSEKYGDARPASAADFWDVEKFPGKRTMYKWMNGMLEAALMADGVARDALYPLDIDRALRKIEAIKPHIVSFWGSGAESQQLLSEGEASLGYIWNTRAILLERDTEGQVKWGFDGGFVNASTWIVPKGNPAGRETGMRFIASAQDPASQVVLFDALGNGPASPQADALIPDDRKAQNCVSDEAMAKQVVLSAEWYADHYSPALEKFLALVSK